MPEIGYREVQKGLRELGLSRASRVIVHASLAAFGPVRGGAETLAGALTDVCGLVLSPANTLQCQVWPLVGPENNAATYAGHDDENANAEIFRQDVPVHGSLGPVAEALRHVPGALRSKHPLYSFTAVGLDAEVTLSTQSLAEPLGPIAHFAEVEPNTDVLLLGVDHSADVSLHYAEARAGRKQFIRWALTPSGAVECPGCPGCPDGFNTIVPHLRGLARVAQIGTARVERIALRELVRVAGELLRNDPAALLCSRPRCERCAAVRAVLAAVA